MDIKTEMQSQFDDINNMLNMIENNIRSSNNDQVKEVCQILKTIINALKDDNKKLHSKAEGLEMKVFENELSLNRLDQYNCRNNIELQGIPLNIDDETLEDKVVNIFESLNTNTTKSNTKDVIDLRKLAQKTKLFNL